MNENRSKQPARDGSSRIETAEEEDFVSRWSRRKTLSRDGIDPTTDEHDETAPSDNAPTTESDDEASAIPDDEPTRLPPLESLDGDSDYSAFLEANVPRDLQRQALRKLFHSPKFNVRDGLDDYDLDFSNPEPLGNVITAEMRHRIRLEFERLAEKVADGDTPEEAAVSAAEADGTGEPETSIDSEPDDARIEPS